MNIVVERFLHICLPNITNDQIESISERIGCHLSFRDNLSLMRTRSDLYAIKRVSYVHCLYHFVKTIDICSFPHDTTDEKRRLYKSACQCMSIAHMTYEAARRELPEKSIDVFIDTHFLAWDWLTQVM